jgi:hypothetical protein
MIHTETIVVPPSDVDMRTAMRSPIDGGLVYRFERLATQDRPGERATIVSLTWPRPIHLASVSVQGHGTLGEVYLGVNRVHGEQSWVADRNVAVGVWVRAIVRHENAAQVNVAWEDVDDRRSSFLEHGS